MHPETIISITTAKTTNYRRTGGSTSEPEITAADAAAACANMPLAWFYAATYKYAQDYDKTNWLRRELMLEGAKIAKNWNLKKHPHMLEKMAILALIEVQAGKIPTSLRMLGLGLKRDSYYRVWQGRYEQIYRLLEQWCENATREIRNNI